LACSLRSSRGMRGDSTVKQASKVTFAETDGSRVAREAAEPVPIAKCRQLLRSVLAIKPEPPPAGEEAPAESVLAETALESAGPELWRYPEEPDKVADKAADKAPEVGNKTKAAEKGGAAAGGVVAGDPSDRPPLEAKADPQAGALLMSHAWDAPDNWSKYFKAQLFADAKQIQVATGLHHAKKRGLAPEGRQMRVWVDCASLPDAVDQVDHPLEKIEYGPFLLPVRELKRLVAPVPGEALAVFTELRLDESMKYDSTMEIRTFDNQGRPSKEAETRQVQWEILPGWWQVRSARVVSAYRLSPEGAAAMDQFLPSMEQLQQWCVRLGLKDEIWVEFTIGTLRTESLNLTDTMIGLHGGMLAVVSWNYFDRLWPLCEWAIFCNRVGPGRVQLAADCFTGAALVEFHRVVRRLSITGAACRDERDRRLLLAFLEREFNCGFEHTTQCFRKPAPGVLTAAVTERVVDFAPLERYIRATAIAVFAREAALFGSRRLTYDDESGWTELANTLKLRELHGVLKKSKPWDWYEDAKRQVQRDPPAAPVADAEQDPELTAELAVAEAEETAYKERVEAWWNGLVLPVLEDERRKAVKR